MFAITDPKSLRLTKLNLRDEHHGDQTKKAADLIVSGQWPNTILDLLHPALRAALYSKAGPAASDDVQRDLDLPVTDMPNIRFARLGTPVKWDLKIEGATVSVHYGAGRPMVLQLCKVDSFTIEPLEGGTVEIGFKISTSTELTEKVLGKLAIITGDIELTLEPPKVEVEPPRGGGATVDWPFGGEGPKTPEDALAGAVK